jgi:hypothetical protein
MLEMRVLLNQKNFEVPEEFGCKLLCDVDSCGVESEKRSLSWW